jgi:hypothetical protein
MPLPFAQILRDFITDGIPSSGRNKPKKSDMRAWGTWVESIISAFTSNGGLIYSSLSLLNADLAKAANSMAWVVGDATAANNGVYGKVGASGTGSWTRRSDLPFSFIIGADAGAGTANAIQSTTSLPVSSSSLVVTNVFRVNTGSPVTISFNGGAALTIKSNSGNDIVAGGLVAGMLIFGYVSGSTFRLISDQVSSAIVAAAEAAAAAAAASAASLNIPTISAGDKGKGLTINAAETGYDKNLLSIVALTRTALKALTTSITRPVYLAESGREGMFSWDGSDRSSAILGAAITSSTVNSTTEVITSVAHGLKTGDAVIATTAVNGLSLQTIYYVIGVDADTFKLASSFANARAGTAFNLTGTTNFSVRQHKDPLEGVYVTPTSDITGASGAWIRKYDDLPTVRVFGAVLDGSTDDSQPIQRALDLLGKAIIPWTSTGFVAANITLGTSQVLIGERKTVFKTTAGASYGVRVTAFGVAKYAFLENFVFDLTASSTSTVAVLFGTSSNIVYGFRGKNLDFKNCGSAIDDEFHATNYVVDVMFFDCYCYYTRGQQVRNRRSRGFFKFNNFKIDSTLNVDIGTQNVTWADATFTDVIGMELEYFDIVGPTYTQTSFSNVYALQILGSGGGKASVWLTRVLVDNTNRNGIIIDDVFNVSGNFVQAYQNLGQGISLNKVTKSRFSDVVVRGAFGLTGAPASTTGIAISGVSSDVVMTNLQVEFCTGAGVITDNSSHISYNGGYSDNNGTYGYIDNNAATNQIRRMGVRSAANGTASLLQIGAQSATVSWYPNSGVYTAASLGALTV